MFEQLQELCKGLNFLSETDSPVEAVTLRKLPRFATFDDFDRVVLNQADFQQEWMNLWSFMQTNLANCEIVKVYGQIDDAEGNVVVYGIGIADGAFYGFKTYATET